MTIYTWDTGNDWTSITTSGDEVSFSRNTTPSEPYRASAGRVTASFVTPGSTSWYAEIEPPNRRCLRSTFFIRFKRLILATEHIGPVEVHGKDADGNDLGIVGHTRISDGGFGGGSTSSVGSISLNREWYLFDVRCTALGDAGAARNSMTVCVYKALRGPRPMLVFTDSMEVYSGIDISDIYRFTKIRIGIRGMVRAAEDFDILIDEFRAVRRTMRFPAYTMKTGPRSICPITL